MKILYLLIILLSISLFKTANAQEPLPTESSTLFQARAIAKPVIFRMEMF